MATFNDEQLERFRQSGIRLDREGRFWHGGAEITHPGLCAALWRWLDRNPDGHYVLRLDAERFVYLDVDETPYLVRSARWEGERAYVLLIDGWEEELAYASLRLRGVAPESVHCTVKGHFDARLSTSAWGVIASRIRQRDDGYWLDAFGGPYLLAQATE